MIFQASHLHWNEVLGDPYTRSLSPLMLQEKGYSVDKLCRTVDSTEKKAYRITYDRGYVCSWMAKKVLKALHIKSKEDAIALMGEVWDYYERSWSGQKNDTE
ncbi:MAG: hypothetical protein ACRC2R_25975 [Xenococcaceae cyanobacterium]